MISPMEGSIYNNISKEINFQLPDINFDSDSDDIDDGEPIKPYIRPPAEILFSNDDSDNEEILNILSKMPPYSVNLEADISVDQNQSASGSSVVSKHSKSSYDLPFNNIKLPNGITHAKSTKEPEGNGVHSRIELSKFGVRDNVDLDKILEEMDLSNYQTTFFDDVLTNYEVVTDDVAATDSKNSALLTSLDEMSKKYEAISKSNYNNNCSLSSTFACAPVASNSLSSLFNQMKREKAIKTVYLDLRSENRLGSLNVETGSSNYGDTNGNEDRTSSSDSEDGDDTGRDENSNLWIDNYRKYKARLSRIAGSRDIAQRKTTRPDSPRVTDEKIAEKLIEINEISEPGIVDVDRLDIGSEKDSETVPDAVRLKIERIKQLEKLLSERRYIINQINQSANSCQAYPTLLHEEISFETSNLHLSRELDMESEDQFFNAFVFLSPPNSVVTISKVSSQFSADHAKENFVALLSLLLQSSSPGSPCHLPFRVLGLQQIGYQNQLQLALLCQTSSSLTKLRSDLKNCTLADLLSSDPDSSQCLSGLPLSNIFRIQPYNPVLNSNIWQWNNGSIVWHKIVLDSVTSCQNKAPKLDSNTSCVVLQPDFYLSLGFRTFLGTVLDRFALVGIRLLHNRDDPRQQQQQLVLAIRGFDAINVIKSIQSQVSYRDKVVCTRFCENSTKELCKYFGPRLNEERVKMLIEKDRCQEITSELSYGMSLYSSLCCSQPSDIMLLVSPMCLDVGWILNLLQTHGGYVLISVVRLSLSVSVGRQIGISEKVLDLFDSQNGICHLLIIRNENPLHSLKYSLNECVSFMTKNDQSEVSVERFFYALPFSESFVNILDVHKAFQTPDVRELKLSVLEAPFEDCEKVAFVLVISDELTRHVAQILDQMTNLDLLAVKCLSTELDEDHLCLIKTEFKLRLPGWECGLEEDCTEEKMRMCVFAVRSMCVIRELEKIQHVIRIEKNLVFAYTITAETSFRMIGSLFTSTELKSDPRRRSSLKFLPEQVAKDLNQMSILAQFPVLYSPIETVLILQINNSESVVSRFRKAWFLLTRDGFSVSKVVLDANRKLGFVVKRPNAVFYLTQWVKGHFSAEDRVELACEVGEVSAIVETMPFYATASTMAILNFSSNVEPAFIMINCDLLESSVEMLSNAKFFWNVLEENRFHCIGLSVVDIDGARIFKLRNISLHNLSGNQLQKETRYLCLLVVTCPGPASAGDFIKLKLDSLRFNETLSDNVFVNCDLDQISQCCRVLLGGVTTNDFIVA